MTNATKYHVNKKTGRAGICRATKKGCPLGEDAPHFDTKEEAKAYIEKREAETHDTFATISKKEKPLTAKQKRELEEAQRKKEEEERAKANKRVRKQIAKIAKDYENSNTPIKTELNAIPWGDATLIKHNELYDKMYNNITDAELKALYKYSTMAHSDIFTYLNNNNNYQSKYIDENTDRGKRRIQEMNEELAQDIRNIDNYLSKAPLEDKIVYRYIKQPVLFYAKDNNQQAYPPDEYAKNLGFEVGKEVNFKSYTSTTFDPDLIAERAEGVIDIALVIQTNKGAPISDTHETEDDYYYGRRNNSDISFIAMEREVLLPRDMKFKVEKIERSRFSGRDGTSQEPLTIWLTEVDDNE